ncbi:MAG TPA: nuclear transport factor 2 family protein [Cyclobacteriaceae bacterium]|nr:nuclear transport factor 2 family protein [Cyclobacteriaceae bacterium]
MDINSSTVPAQPLLDYFNKLIPLSQEEQDLVKVRFHPHLFLKKQFALQHGDDVFSNFTYTLKFTVLEIQVSGSTAFARSTSKGSFVIKSKGQTAEDENRELFVFEKQKGEWKIARYMYNKAK